MNFSAQQFSSTAFMLLLILACKKEADKYAGCESNHSTEAITGNTEQSEYLYHSQNTLNDKRPF